MTDRELLELAAKAAGVRQIWVETSLISEWVLLDSDNKELPSWNPLTDDGDALRLAVKLCLVINIGEMSATVYGEFDSEICTIFGDDPYAATRRAIVRAAAEIGKEQK